MPVSIDDESSAGTFNPDDLLAQGWVDRDIPWTSAEMWPVFIDAIGQKNIIFLAGSKRGSDGAMRAQVLVSPAGMESLKAWLAARRNKVPQHEGRAAASEAAG